MQMFIGVKSVYLHRHPIDFRKSINGLSLIVEHDMQLSPMSDALFIFCNRQRDKIKALYWDRSGFCLWYKRLEEEQFKWPLRWQNDVIELSEAQLHGLLSGYDIAHMTPHRVINYAQLS